MPRVLVVGDVINDILVKVSAPLVHGDDNPAVIRVPARPVAVRDTTGAGDVFCAGFLAAWLAGGSLAAAGSAGAEVAARAVAALSGRPG